MAQPGSVMRVARTGKGCVASPWPENAVHGDRGPAPGEWQPDAGPDRDTATTRSTKLIYPVTGGVGRGLHRRSSCSCWIVARALFVWSYLDPPGLCAVCAPETDALQRVPVGTMCRARR